MDFQELFEKYLNLSYRYLTIRNRSKKEIRDYLTKKKAAEEIIDKIVAHLTEKKFLNDETFARFWVLNRARVKPKGNMLLQIELRQKGISDDVIKKVLEQVQAEIPDELEQAKGLITRRMEKVRELPRKEIYQKVGGFLARRGFSWEITKKAIDSYLQN
ncbi:MAG TPA: regulatory protein RecX [Candidatus Saccharimonadales bacterium]|nr:regulatory protein RecX [Candidatus Saccharimonadales bacterium]